MAAGQSIPPFPPNLDRNHFAAWLSGFVDGEGCFRLGLCCVTPGRPKTPHATLEIRLRLDDFDVLRLIRSYFGCGNLYVKRASKPQWHPNCNYHVKRIADLSGIIVPHFERYPLLAKKRLEFSIWKEGVALIQSVVSRGRRGSDCGRQGGRVNWADAELSRFVALHSALRSQREFLPPSVTE